MSRVRAIKGMNDIRPRATEAFLDSALWEYLQTTAAAVLAEFGYRRVWLPVVEETALFARGIGEDTDIVSKEMYSFTDRGGRALTLRPEGTAGAVRAYVQHSLDRTERIQKWWYMGPMFRAERPQKGRYRQFYQIGAEYFGVASPAADAEMLHLLWVLCHRLGLHGVQVRLNTLGDDATRQAYRDALQEVLRARSDSLCPDCQRRVETNPLRVLDCKRPGCREASSAAPDILEVISAPAQAHFERVLALLDELGVDHVRDPHLVRGLDYYTGTIFELTTTALGSQDAILGGGRYDKLVAELGGSPTPAIGFAAGLERLAMLVEAPQDAQAPQLYIIPMGELEGQALRLAAEVRALGWRVDVDVAGGRLKQQMRRADRSGARWALVVGEQELAQGRAQLKNLRDAAAATELELTPAALDKIMASTFC